MFVKHLFQEHKHLILVFFGELFLNAVNKQQEVIVFDLKRHMLAVQAADRDANESVLNR